MTPKFVFAINYTADTNQLLTERLWHSVLDVFKQNVVSFRGN